MNAYLVKIKKNTNCSTARKFCLKTFLILSVFHEFVDLIKDPNEDSLFSKFISIRPRFCRSRKNCLNQRTEFVLMLRDNDKHLKVFCIVLNSEQSLSNVKFQ
jgi:hypothetical protein